VRDAAARRQKSLNEMASEAVSEGLKLERLDHLQALLSKGHCQRAVSGISEDSVVD
jgi:hypothetical protein